MTNEDWKILASWGITPDNLNFKSSLDLEGTQITALPDGLSVGYSLDLRGTQITALPDSLSVGRAIYLEGTQITALFRDRRGYRLDRAGDRYIAGCRNFSAGEALSHWGAKSYPGPKRGEEYCAAIREEEARRAKA